MFDVLTVWKPEWLSNWMIIVFLLLFCYYKHLAWNFGVFKKLGIPGPKPYLVFGNFLQLQKKGMSKYDLDLKKTYGPIVGSFLGRRPLMVIFDTHLLKQILIKNFNLFPNRMDLEISDPPIDKMVVLIKDDHWRHVRSILTPTFSSGKLRKMSPQMNKCCENLCENLKRKAETGEIFDIRVLCGSFTMDTIASTAFGIDIDSLNDTENAFVKNANKIFKFRLNFATVVSLFFKFLNKPLRYLGLTIMDKSVIQFFVSVIGEAIQQRKKEKGSTDFLQLMLNAHLEDNVEDKESKDGNTNKITKGLTEDELMAQGFLFFLAGYETTANTLSLFAYLMALNPDIQERLYKELVETVENDEDVSYDSVNKLVYLDMCFSETLRMYPAGPRTDRVASQDVTIDGLFIPKGMNVCVPIHALQNDPEYWNEPWKFDPERFSPSVKASIDPFRYMPFGVGPRNCVGMRLAILEIKMAIIKMFKRFQFHACKETEVPLELEPMAMRGKNGIKITVSERN